MERKVCCEKDEMERDAWSSAEDEILMNYGRVNGDGNWKELPKRAGLNRCGWCCKLRWLNHLKLEMNRGNIFSDEEELIIRLHKLLGNRWSIIAGRLPGRNEKDVENFWKTYLSKKVKEKRNNNEVPHTSITNTSKSSIKSSTEIKTHAMRLGQGYHTNAFSQWNTQHNEFNWLE